VDAVYFLHAHTHQHYAQAHKLVHQIDVQEMSIVARTNEEGEELIRVPLHLCDRSTGGAQVAERARKARECRVTREIMAVDDSEERRRTMPNAAYNRRRQALSECLYHYLRQSTYCCVLIVEILFPKLKLTKVVAKQSEFVTKMTMRLSTASMHVKLYFIFIQAEVGEESVEEQLSIVVLVSTMASLTLPGYKRSRVRRMR
jgi:hypothetical protein